MTVAPKTDFSKTVHNLKNPKTVANFEAGSEERVLRHLFEIDMPALPQNLNCVVPVSTLNSEIDGRLGRSEAKT